MQTIKCVVVGDGAVGKVNKKKSLNKIIYKIIYNINGYLLLRKKYN